jgi:hypothetical protein
MRKMITSLDWLAERIFEPRNLVLSQCPDFICVSWRHASFTFRPENKPTPIGAAPSPVKWKSICHPATRPRTTSRHGGAGLTASGGANPRGDWGVCGIFRARSRLHGGA